MRALSSQPSERRRSSGSLFLAGYVPGLHLGARLAQGPAADRDDQARGFGQRDGGAAAPPRRDRPWPAAPVRSRSVPPPLDPPPVSHSEITMLLPVPRSTKLSSPRQPRCSRATGSTASPVRRSASSSFRDRSWPVVTRACIASSSLQVVRFGSAVTAYLHVTVTFLQGGAITGSRRDTPARLRPTAMPIGCASVMGARNSERTKIVAIPASLAHERLRDSQVTVITVGVWP